MTEFERYMDTLVEALREPVPSLDEVQGIVQKPYDDPRFKGPKAEPEEIEDGLEIAARELTELRDPLQASRLAYACGVFVEAIDDAYAIALPVATVLARCLALYGELARAVDPEGEGIDDPFAHWETHPDGVRAWVGLRDLSLAAMTCLCRNQEARIKAREIPGLVQNANDLEYPNDFYVAELLNAVDNLEVLVIHCEMRRGYVVVAEAVRNNFHLFSLLQGALIGDPLQAMLPGPEQDPQMVAYARGETHERPDDSDCAVWHFATHRAWSDAGFDNDIRETSIWGEMSPREIPQFDGRPVVLLGPLPLKSKTWDANFIASLHDAHRARTWIRTHLTKRETNEYLDRIAEASREG